ncbi:AIF_collapsed_G0031960.mRNA.1.CDS.1 [Saccharomyces cerevisiae]|nr:AIF_collapsed_G0031960.mRNA.1.CDS.1 [Saccharomyces cerevisiae]
MFPMRLVKDIILIRLSYAKKIQGNPTLMMIDQNDGRFYGKNSFKTSKEPDLLLKYWEMFRNVYYYIDDAGELIAAEFTVDT